MLNKKIFLILTSTLVLSCAVTESPTNVKPSTLTSASPLASVSAIPSVATSITPSASASVVPSSTPTPSTVFVPAENGTLILKEAYLKTPSSAFLSEKNFDIQFKVSLSDLPVKDQIFSFFDSYDASEMTKLKSHYSLNMDSTGIFSLTANAQDYSKVFNFNFKMAANKDYVFSFKKTNDSLEITIDGISVFSTSFKYDDFYDTTGKRTINFGADMNGKNKTPLKISYIKIPDVLTYLFKKDFTDSYKYSLDGVVKEGSYEFIYKDKFDVISTPTPVATATATPTASPSLQPVTERETSNTDGMKIKLDLNVYDPNNSAQYTACIDEKTAEENRIRSTTTNTTYTSTKNCADPNGVFYSKWFDFGSKGTTSNPSDFRFATDVYQDFSEITLSGANTGIRTQILDIGIKNYEGVNLSYLMNKVDYTNKNTVYSDNIYSTKAIQDHVYAIKTYQYGKEPRYAKLVVNNIITNDYNAKKLESPQIVAAPQQQLLGSGTSNLSNTATYDYYVSTYDGVGETAPRFLGQVAQSGVANSSTNVMSFIVPYGSKGFILYRKITDNATTRILKVGPFISKTDQTVLFDDNGTKGTLVDSLPISDTTTKYVFKPTVTSKAIGIEFSYTFFGSM